MHLVQASARSLGGGGGGDLVPGPVEGKNLLKMLKTTRAPIKKEIGNKKTGKMKKGRSKRVI